MCRAFFLRVACVGFLLCVFACVCVCLRVWFLVSACVFWYVSVRLQTFVGASVCLRARGGVVCLWCVCAVCPGFRARVVYWARLLRFVRVWCVCDLSGKCLRRSAATPGRLRCVCGVSGASSVCLPIACGASAVCLRRCRGVAAVCLRRVRGESAVYPRCV